MANVVGKVAKGLLRSIPVVGDVGAELLTKTPSQKPTSSTTRTPRNKDVSLERIKYALEGK